MERNVGQLATPEVTKMQVVGASLIQGGVLLAG